MKEYVGTLPRFVKATPIQHRCPPIRFAIGDLYPLQNAGNEYGVLWIVKDFTVASHKGYGMLLRDILCTLVTAKPSEGKQAWFVAYSRQSGL